MSKLSEIPPENLIARAASGSLVPTPEFSLERRGILLRIAHQAILSALDGRLGPEEAPFPSALSEARGVFTTLYLDRQLRGCVGYAVAVLPLYRAVAETARAAAFEDSRFSPVTVEEALRLEVSLSVLSPLFPIHAEAVEPGCHGLVIAQGNRRGLLLPQVAIEHGWGRETFLEQACRKAGLAPDAWRKGASVEAFTAEVFGDNDVGVSC